MKWCFMNNLKSVASILFFIHIFLYCLTSLSQEESTVREAKISVTWTRRHQAPSHLDGQHRPAEDHTAPGTAAWPPGSVTRRCPVMPHGHTHSQHLARQEHRDQLVSQFSQPLVPVLSKSLIVLSSI